MDNVFSESQPSESNQSRARNTGTALTVTFYCTLPIRNLVLRQITDKSDLVSSQLPVEATRNLIRHGSSGRFVLILFTRLSGRSCLAVATAVSAEVCASGSREFVELLRS